MNILVIGSGAREHAIIWALNKSKNVDNIYCCPGNGGINKISKPVLIAINDSEEVINFCNSNDIDFVVIGPEAPLVDGLVDKLNQANIKAFGPKKAAARLEGSKDFTKEICTKYNIPTAAYESFTNAKKAKEYVQKQQKPIVIKADGLAAGKGVIIAKDNEEAFEAIDDMLINNKFGDAGSLIVIEEFLEGEEISVFALVDGENALYFGSAQDHKAVGEGDTGPNTGGMGTYSPAPIMTDNIQKQIMDDAINPLVKGLANENVPYNGILFAGFMVTKQGPKLLEINVRFGDPETQVLMARLESDLLELLLATEDGTLASKKVKLKDDVALCVVMAAKGYPGSYEKGSQINDIEEAEKLENVTIFHAGTKQAPNGAICANGGRVLGITAIGSDVKSAQNLAYKAVDLINWPDGFCRRDIGWRALGK